METDSSFLLELGLGAAGVAEIRIHPFRKSSRGGAELFGGEARADYIDFVAALSAPLDEERRLAALWREQCRTLLDSWYKPRLARGALFASEDPAERRRAGLTFLNLMENDEHGEVLKQALLDEVTGNSVPDEEARGFLDGLMARLEGFAAEGA